jgi:hypothetical protein
MKTRPFTLFLFFLLFLATEGRGQWTVVCNTGNGFVDDFATYNGSLYATGFFTTLCGTPCSYVAGYDGSSWQATGNGFLHAGHHLAVIDSILYGARYEPDIDSNWLYRYDGSDFVRFGEGVYLTTAVPGFSQTANLYNMTEYNGSIVVCGEFDRAGSKAISGIMRWDGTSWDSLGSGLTGNIPGTAPVMYPHDLCIFGTDLVAAGNFHKAGGQVVNGIARWDGTQWHPMGEGFNSTVYGICVFNGELYAGGDFTLSGITPLTCIAKWNGTAWVSPGFSLFYISPMNYSFIHTLKVLNNKLLISGGFDRVVLGPDTMFCTAVAAFDGTVMDTLDGGLPGKEAEALAVYNGSLYAGGGLYGSSYIARYALSTSIQKNPDTGPDVNVYPNPSASLVTVVGEKQIDRLSVSDTKGRIVYTSEPKEKSFSFALSSKGVYFITISTGNKTFIKKIVICN